MSNFLAPALLSIDHEGLREDRHVPVYAIFNCHLERALDGFQAESSTYENSRANAHPDRRFKSPSQTFSIDGLDFNGPSTIRNAKQMVPTTSRVHAKITYLTPVCHESGMCRFRFELALEKSSFESDHNSRPRLDFAGSTRSKSTAKSWSCRPSHYFPNFIPSHGFDHFFGHLPISFENACRLGNENVAHADADVPVRASH